MSIHVILSWSLSYGQALGVWNLHFLLLGGFRFWFYPRDVCTRHRMCKRRGCFLAIALVGMWTSAVAKWSFFKDFQITLWESPTFAPQLRSWRTASDETFIFWIIKCWKWFPWSFHHPAFSVIAYVAKIPILHSIML